MFLVTRLANPNILYAKDKERTQLYLYVIVNYTVKTVSQIGSSPGHPKKSRRSLAKLCDRMVHPNIKTDGMLNTQHGAHKCYS